MLEQGEIQTAQSLPPISAQLGWRVEVQKRGRYWQWRQGRADNRKAHYGGKFELLTDERKVQYEKNKAKRQKAIQNNGTRSTPTS